MKIKTVNITDQVVEYLKENIESGKWNIGEKIPSENQMVMELGVSRSSIRSALQYLDWCSEKLSGKRNVPDQHSG